MLLRETGSESGSGINTLEVDAAGVLTPRLINLRAEGP